MHISHILVVIVAVSPLGILASLFMNQGLWWDEAVYLGLGRAIMKGQYSLHAEYPLESFRPPLFPFLLSAFSDSILASRFLASSLAALSAIAAYFLAKEIFNKKTALWSLLLFATSYLFVFFSTKILSESLFIIFSCISLIYFSRFAMKGNSGKHMALCGLFAGLAFMTRYIGFLLILSYFLFLSYSLLKKQHRPSGFACFVSAIFLSTLPWMALSWVYYGSPIGSFMENIRVFSGSPPEVLVSNYISLFSNVGPLAGFLPALVVLAFYSTRNQKTTLPQKAVFLLLLLGLAYFILLPYREIRYLLSFLPLATAIAGFGIAGLSEKYKLSKTPVFATIIILSIISMLVGFQSAWDNRLASHAAVEASQYLKTIETDSVLTQMYPYAYYFSGKKAVQFCENHFANPDFEKCQKELITNTYNPEKIPHLMEKYDIQYILFYRFEPTNPQKVFDYLESNPRFKKIKSFDEFGTEAAIIYEYR